MRNLFIIGDYLFALRFSAKSCKTTHSLGFTVTQCNYATQVTCRYYIANKSLDCEIQRISTHIRLLHLSNLVIYFEGNCNLFKKSVDICGATLEIHNSQYIKQTERQQGNRGFYLLLLSWKNDYYTQRYIQKHPV